MNQVEVKRRQIQSFSYVLACINIWVFGKSIGDNGLGYLAAAVLVFALFWVLTGKNLPDRMGRMLRGRNARGQYRNVSRMRKNMMLFQIAEGLLGTVLCMSLGWILLEKVFLVPYGSMILWILSPALFLRCIQSVFLGYFQSEGSEMPSAVSSVLRQVFFLGLGLVFLGIFRNYGEKVSLLLKRADFTSMYGAMGIAVGMLLSEVLVLLFVFVIYRGSMAGRREAESGMKGTDSFSSQLRTLLIPMGGDILRDMFLLLPLWIGLLFFQKRSADIYASVSAYGIFVGRYLITILMPVAILSAGILPGVARTGSHIRKKEERYARTAFQAGVQGTVVHGFFFTAWIAVLATPLSQALDKSAEMALTGLFTTGSSLILWLLLLFYFSEILELRGGKASAPGRIRHSGYREHRDIADSSEYGKYNNGIIFKPCAGDGSGRNCSRHTCLPSNEDLAGSVADTGNSRRKLLCLRIAGFWAGEDLPAPSGGNGNGAAGTGDHRCGLLVFAFDVTQFPWTGSELCSRR